MIPLGQSQDLRTRYATFWGGVRLGRILGDLDILAGWICHLHNQEPGAQRLKKSRLATVTASVDRIEMNEFDLSVEKVSFGKNWKMVVYYSGM